MPGKGAAKSHKLPEQFPPGEILVQTGPRKKTWQLGEVIGWGGFGLIYKVYDVSEGPPCLASLYVVKIEPLDNGPLFCEFHFYQRAAKQDMIIEWTQAKKLKYLGVPQCLGSGQHQRENKHYRFLVMQHLGFNLQKLFVQKGRSFTEKTVFSVGLRMLDALEYIHANGYCHADIKAENILLGYSNGKVDFNQVYLVDYGLASSYQVDGVPKTYKENPKRAHDGTTEYTSRDAHKGAYPSRRGDLEILGYCMLEWLTGGLPWSRLVHNKDSVRDLKVQYMNDIPGLLKACFGTKPCPEGLRKYLVHVGHLAYSAEPNYHQFRQCLRSGSDDGWTLGLFDSATQIKGVKRKNESNSMSTPPRTKVHPTCSTAPPGPAGIQREATSHSRPTSSISTTTPSRPAGVQREATSHSRPDSSRTTASLSRPTGIQREATSHSRPDSSRTIASPSRPTGVQREATSHSQPDSSRTIASLSRPAGVQREATSHSRPDSSRTIASPSRPTGVQREATSHSRPDSSRTTASLSRPAGVQREATSHSRPASSISTATPSRPTGVQREATSHSQPDSSRTIASLSRPAGIQRKATSHSQPTSSRSTATVPGNQHKRSTDWKPRPSANADWTPGVVARVSEQSRKPFHKPQRASVKMRRPTEVSTSGSSTFETWTTQEDAMHYMYYQEPDILEDERDISHFAEEDIEELPDLYLDEEEPHMYPDEEESYWRCSIL